ncbi:MAG: hypothetical protein OIN66_03585 [Candidatus Methanoperedens sp.]|nr:hypothetical protein [Candidatus Methanoperedens sp.]
MVYTHKKSDFEVLSFEILRLLFRYISLKINTQHILFFLVLVTFDIGDAVTGALMMDAKGIGAEYNFIVRDIYVNYGLAGLIAAKLWFIIIPLMVASIINKKSYWMINGILVALIIAGVMAIQANLQALSGVPFNNPSDIIFTYVAVLTVLSTAGNLIDEHVAKNRVMST